MNEYLNDVSGLYKHIIMADHIIVITDMFIFISLIEKEYLSQYQAIQMKRERILLVVAFLLELYKILTLRIKQKRLEKLWSKIFGLEILKIQDLAAKIKNGFVKVGEFILCKGTLSSPEKLSTVLLPSQSIVYSELTLQKTFEIGNRTTSITKKIRDLHPSFLSLISTKTKTVMNIYETFNTKFITNRVRQKINYYQNTIFSLSWLISVLVKMPTRMISSKFRQRFIPQNNESVVLGVIQQAKITSSKPQSHELFIKSPMIIAQSKSEILHFLEQTIGNIKFQFICFCVLQFFTTYFVIRYAVVPVMKQFFKSKKNDPQNVRLKKIEVKNRVCQICLDQLNSILSLSCQHMAICSHCYQKQRLIDDSIICKLCNKKSKGILKIFPC